ncbi:NAD(P)-binding protein [Neocallimastix lanati (nom. inval.)]|jgi:NAD(P)H dehydrogenase (quinone)|uniref:NAD(P)-binding protein n=1 Tax=Neocallimastix californiae TaxID=1754190 RepID=A0A1Y2BY61_9FUNG|nr:NAD(P)-binding protein [Neocallimastix sp. JGI-2020a]ORY39712.1 NAD(P)-binding protein [Neocallimastix californiae]|eukprot:ORY39712.1 NAD(P)-binding protein [Neocallimastix californiae]
MGKIAILGSTGKFGGKTIDYLIERGVSPSDIIAIYRNEEKALPLKDRGIEIRYGDYSKDTFSPAVFEGAEKLLFVSSSSWTEFERIQEHVFVLDNVRKSGIKHIVYTSMANPEGSIFKHEQTHVSTELAIKATNIPYTILRNTFYLQYFLVQKDLKRCVDSGIFYNLSEGKKINLVTRDNMAKAAAVILTTEGHLNKTYEITAPKAYSYKDICDILSDVSGKKIEFVKTTEKEYLAYLASLGIPEKYQKWDSLYAQKNYACGWAEKVSPDLANLIGEENITTPRQIIETMDFN